MNASEYPDPIAVPCLAGAKGIAHGFFTRRGGVSEGLYGSLNCGPGSLDDPERVAANRGRAVAALGHGDLVTCYQVHSARVVCVRGPWDGDPPQADGMASATPGVVLGVLTADCAPVLFADVGAGVIGAAHAGWRGARAGVLEATVAAMVGLGATPEAIRAGVGPCIGQESYEVGPEFKDDFISDDPENAGYFVPSGRDGHVLFNLPGYVSGRLERIGLERVEALSLDTYAHEDRFFSYRRVTHQGGKDYGRNLSAIVLGG